MDAVFGEDALFGDDADASADASASASASAGGSFDFSTGLSALVSAGQAIVSTTQAVKDARAAVSGGAPPAVVAAHAANIVSTAQQQPLAPPPKVVHLHLYPPTGAPAPAPAVAVFTPPAHGATLDVTAAAMQNALTANQAVSKAADPYLFGLLGGAAGGAGGWFALQVAGAVGGGLLGVAGGFLFGRWLSKRP